LHEIFSATPPEVIETIAFTGFVTIIDGATGKPAHSHLFSVSAERSVFGDLVLAAVEPAACLTYLNAPGSPQPSGAEPFLA
jgi:restriction system protein